MSEQEVSQCFVAVVLFGIVVLSVLSYEEKQIPISLAKERTAQVQIIETQRTERFHKVISGIKDTFILWGSSK